VVERLAFESGLRVMVDLVTKAHTSATAYRRLHRFGMTSVALVGFTVVVVRSGGSVLPGSWSDSRPAAWAG